MRMSRLGGVFILSVMPWPPRRAPLCPPQHWIYHSFNLCTYLINELPSIRCKICNKDITFYFAAVRDHIVKKHKMKMSDYKTRYSAFSQEHMCTADLGELARVRCRVCGLVLLHHRVRAHLLSVHGSSRKGGYEFIKQTFYRHGAALLELPEYSEFDSFPGFILT